MEFVQVPKSAEGTTEQNRKSMSSRASLSRTTETEEPCWEIIQTGELFDVYEEYLMRMDFYHRKVFTCEISGRSGLNFFDALASEVSGSKEVQDAFPESLREPVLRLVQHRVEQRLEQLVNTVHDKFNETYFPGEQIHISRSTGESLEGKIREKTVLAGGIPRYTVSLSQSKNSFEDIEVEGEQIRRERRNFNKQLIRSFLRDSLTKEPWHGSPWCVKPALTIKYGLPTAVPGHLQHSAITEKRKQEAQQKKALQQQSKEAHKSMGIITDFRQYPSSKKNGPAPPHMPSGPGVMQPVWSSKPGAKAKNHKFMPKANVAVAERQFIQFSDGLDLRMSHFAPGSNGEPELLVIGQDGLLHYPNGTIFQNTSMVILTNEEEKSHPQMVKWPIEDLEVPIKPYHIERPALKTYTDLAIAGLMDDGDCPTGKFDITSTGPLLEVWNTLNVHSEVFVLDSFTFDDFVQALRFSSPVHTCELLAEAHCAVLKQFVDEDGKLLIDLPHLQEDSESSLDSEEENASSLDKEESPEPEIQPLRRATRASLRKEEIAAVKDKSPTPNPYAHRGEEYHAQAPWLERCKDRDFARNAWIGVLAGFLYHLSLAPHMKTRCEEILCELLPHDEEPTDDVVVENYRLLDANLRLQALQIITRMTINTLAIREQLDRMNQEMTDLRKKKIDHQRARKE